jgi:aminopeptidase N
MIRRMLGTCLVLMISSPVAAERLPSDVVPRAYKLWFAPNLYRVLNALPWFRDPALTHRTLELALSPAVRSQDTGTVIAQAMRRPDSREAAWAFTKAHWSELVGKLDTFQGIPAIVSGIGSFCSAAGAADIRRFFDEHPTPSSTRAIRRSLERVEACSAVADRQAGPMHAFLTSQGSAGVR